MRSGGPKWGWTPASAAAARNSRGAACTEYDGRRVSIIDPCLCSMDKVIVWTAPFCRYRSFQSAEAEPSTSRMTESPTYPRNIRPRLVEALADTPVTLIHGPRQCGKTTLAQAFTRAEFLHATWPIPIPAAPRDRPRSFGARVEVPGLRRHFRRPLPGCIVYGARRYHPRHLGQGRRPGSVTCHAANSTRCTLSSFACRLACQRS